MKIMISLDILEQFSAESMFPCLFNFEYRHILGASSINVNVLNTFLSKIN